MAAIVNGGHQPASPIPAISNKAPGNVASVLRSRPGRNFRIRDKQRGAGGLRHLRSIPQDLRPKLRHKAAFVDPVDQFRFRGFAFQLLRPCSLKFPAADQSTSHQRGQKRTSVCTGVMSALGPGCVKTSTSRERAELFSLFAFLDGARSAVLFLFNLFEANVLRASRTSEFSHSLGHFRKSAHVTRMSAPPLIADIGRLHAQVRFVPLD
jgi:hypothetical protein